MGGGVFRTALGVNQICLLSPIMFNIFLVMRLAKQFHLLLHQVQALQVPRRLHSTRRLRYLVQTFETLYPKTAPHLQYGAQDQRVRPEHDFNACWSTRVPNREGKTTTVALVWSHYQARISMQDFSPLHARERSTSKPS
ncbi:hypothetical protein DPMN_164123 [Dreissena polymorpha]|uniref:Uncharacterized protein n=1 Tax=Dreissena polymorpha TaxID=45954 RepID=A0A9D4ESC6_DREPO|nr:hypothetical protein DPMN_164123 [Dreissena polymorpha]